MSLDWVSIFHEQYSAPSLCSSNKHSVCNIFSGNLSVRHPDQAGCWKTNLTMIKQRPSFCAHLLSPFQSVNLLPSLSVAVKYLFLLLPEILVFTSEMTWRWNCTLRTSADRPTLKKHLCPPLSSLCLIIVTGSSGCPKDFFEKLQKVQNSAARLVLKAHKRDHVSPLLRTLHWLPIQAYIEYKLSTLCHSFFLDTSSVYLSDLFHVYSPLRQLRFSSDSRTLHILHIKTKTFGHGSFSHAAPSV